MVVEKEKNKSYLNIRIQGKEKSQQKLKGMQVLRFDFNTKFIT